MTINDSLGQKKYHFASRRRVAGRIGAVIWCVKESERKTPAMDNHGGE
jgi:hypothetical protein